MDNEDYTDERSDNDQRDIVDESVIDEDTDLDWALITYALNSNRLIFIGNHNNWSAFHSSNRENGDKYLDYTPEQLRKRFLEHILPHIDDYELTEHEENLLNLLKLHPNFRRTEIGYVPVEQTDNLNLPQGDVSLQRHVAAISADVNSIDSNDQIVIAPIGQQDTYNKFKFSDVDAALLSLCLSSNIELPNCELLPISEIQKRIKDAKYQFECTGQQPENINIFVDELIKKLKMVVELKDAIMELINKRFCS